ncbi:hypothetical protein [Hymenobacter sp. PAMC 26628]|uniref:hypothetical protein n=1 Tax=Hymenobacter sp. PAMC 26628 TaxID=1484118 RepID=UPI0007704BF3|nr:hypothetical protein [Hymenobacter sp. PAMC 26628]AMJ66553.1 hypothetical protein AXW84_14780 [Hymenobacter sp. PAMC 26628]
MRLLFILVGLLLPQVLWAQFFNSFEPGSYRLVNSPDVHYQGLLKLRGNDQLLVEDADGKKTKLAPQEVTSFRLGAQKYVTAGGFRTTPGPFGRTVEQAFVEQLDSGQVNLMEYTYIITTGGSNGAVGSSEVKIYIIKAADWTDAIALPGYAWTNRGEKLRDALRPYAINRPDLTELIDNNQLRDNNIPAFFHALNSGQPFPLTEAMEHKIKKEKERPIEDPFRD